MKDSDFDPPGATGKTQLATSFPKHGSPQRFIPQGLYMIQRDSFRQPIGYLEHGPVMPDGTLQIHAAELDTRAPEHHSAFRLIHKLINLARQHHAKSILVAQPSNPHHVAFWRGCGFDPRAIAPPTAHSATPLVQYEYIFAERA